MKRSLFQVDRVRQRLVLSSLGAWGGVAIALHSGVTAAQLIPDNTLGTTPSQVIPDGALNSRIEGGAQRGSNLFHSFQEFNIPDGGAVLFENPASIDTVLTRVTGNNISNIAGPLGVDGAADLFLLNPNGIIFSEGARLDLQGSFVTTTADTIQFPDQGSFSALNPTEPGLLTVRPSALSFSQASMGGIEHRAIAPAGTSLAGTPLFGLQVPNGESLLFLGGDIVVDRGRSYALGGRIEFASIAQSGDIGLFESHNGGLRLQIPPELERGEIRLENVAVADVRADQAGDIQIYGENVRLLDSLIFAGIESSFGTSESQAGDVTVDASQEIELLSSRISNSLRVASMGQGGDVILRAGSIKMSDRGLIFVDTDGQGNAGSVLFQARDQIQITNGSIIFNRIFGPEAEGNTGGVVFEARNIEMRDGSEIVANVTLGGRGDVGDVILRATEDIVLTGTEDEIFGSGVFNVVRFDEGAPLSRGNAGDIQVFSKNLSITDGARLQAGSRGIGNAGNIEIQVTENIYMDAQESRSVTGLFSDLDANGEGRGGDIRIIAKNLSVNNGAQLVTNTVEQGDAGNILINVEEQAVFQGENSLFSASESVSGAFSAVGGVIGDSDRLGEQSRPVGNGGEISIFAGELLLRNGGTLEAVVRAGGRGDAGDVRVQVRDRFVIEGKSPRDIPSGIRTSTQAGAVGNAANIQIVAPLLSLSRGGELQASVEGESPNNQPAGSIEVNSDVVELTDGARLATQTAGGSRAGDILLDVSTQLRLEGRDTGLFADTQEQSTGRGGSVVLSSQANSAVLQLRDGAEISVDSQGSGEGGSIDLAADNIALKNASISASTASNQGGNIKLNALGTLLLREGSNVATNAGQADTGGDGGNIQVDAEFVLATPNEDSNITANAFEGRGGNVRIQAQGIYNLEFRQEELPGSNDITASSEFGSSGLVELDTPELDPTRGTAELPADVQTTQISQSCQSNPDQGSSFIATGRGGLPLAPSETSPNPVFWEDLRTVALTEEVLAARARPKPIKLTQASPQLHEAQGWFLRADGTVKLTEKSQSAIYHYAPLAHHHCQLEQAS